MIPLAVANDRSRRLCEILLPFCKSLQVVGSIRRQKPEVKDIDLLCIFRPRGAVDLLGWFKDNRHAKYAPGTQESMPQLISAGAAKMAMVFETTAVDLWFATEETWGVLGLIRTGSADHNKKLCILAKNQGWHFAVGGAHPGIYDQNGKKLAGDTEAEFFRVLGIDYVPPHRRG